jgi:SAM-dependent methyltransferase
MTTSSHRSSNIYDADLAHIHVEGYGFHWSGAAASLLKWFVEFGVPKDGKVVDLGCGGGQWLQHLSIEGYRGCGIDVSENMIRIAKQNAPDAEFIHGSLDEVRIPACVAATSLGEPLNYLNSGQAMRRAMRNVFAALSPGGAFIFDVRHPATGPVEVQNHFKSAEEWFCHARIEENYRTQELTRYITTFRLQNDGRYRRDEEVHRLKVFSRAEVTEWLRKVGFRVRTKRGYGVYQLGPRQSVFICRKPKA